VRHVFPLLAVLSLAFAPVPLPRHDPGPDDLKLMQGEWELNHSLKDGVRTPPVRPAFWNIKGDRLISSVYVRKGCLSRIVLDGRTTPRSIDLCHTGDNDDPMQGRYRLEKDTLRVSFGEKRPPDLTDLTGGSDAVWVFKRVKH